MIDAGKVGLDRDELFDVRVPVVQHEHERAPARAALLDDVAGGYRVEFAPRARPAGGAVHRANIGAARSQARKINAHAAAARHDLRHHAQVFQDAAAAIVRRGDHVAVVERDLVARARAGQDAAAGHELEVLQRPVEFFFPRGAVPLFFHGGNTARDALPHLLRIVLQGSAGLVL